MVGLVRSTRYLLALASPAPPAPLPRSGFVQRPRTRHDMAAKLPAPETKPVRRFIRRIGSREFWSLSLAGKWDDIGAIKKGRHTFISDYLLERPECRVIICELGIPNDRGTLLIDDFEGPLTFVLQTKNVHLDRNPIFRLATR